MINLLLKHKFYLEHRTEKIDPLKRTLISKIWLNGLKLIDTYLIYFIVYTKHYLGCIKVDTLEDSKDLPIVSITTFPARAKHLWLTLYFIFRQTIRPGKIIIVFSKQEFSNGTSSLPQTLLYYSKKGVEFCFVDYNLRPHNKYYYAMQNYHNRIIITLDDDLLYYEDTIERLMNLHRKYPNCVCSNRVTKMKVINNAFCPMNEWHLTFAKHGPSLSLLALGYSGVLYPEGWCNSDILYDKRLIKELSLYADDLWLKAIELKEGVKVVSGEYYAHPVTIPTSQKIALRKVNTRKDNPRNNTIWNDLVNYFSFNYNLGELE